MTSSPKVALALQRITAVLILVALAPPTYADVIHGCTIDSAVDRRGEAGITLQWLNPHNECIIVSPGTTVTWNGNFNAHPLAGGVSPTKDVASPISSPGDDLGSVTFNAVGDYPYFCRIHTATMTGVIYVRTTGPVDFGKSGPANGAGGQTTTLTLSWSASANATAYEYCTDTSGNDVCDAGWTDVGTALSAELSALSANTEYHWQVRAGNASGTTEADGGVWWNFITSDFAETVFEDGFESGIP